MKNKILRRLKEESAQLCPQCKPRFYQDFQAELLFATDTFFSHPLPIRCREDVLPFLNDNFGHGIAHSKKVAIEACALTMREAGIWGLEKARRLSLLAMIAGLLHDSCRHQGEHAARGGELALLVLHDYPFSDAEKNMIAAAIACHEAFSNPTPSSCPETRLLSNALYDADKFRWGPDNFVTTLWEVCNYQDWTLTEILDKFPEGLEMVRAVRHTFRTTNGQIYGPEFIEQGLLMGAKIYRRIEECLNDTKTGGQCSS